MVVAQRGFSMINNKTYADLAEDYSCLTTSKLLGYMMALLSRVDDTMAAPFATGCVGASQCPQQYLKHLQLTNNALLLCVQ